MLNPDAAQILRAIEETLVDVVEPTVTATSARSALATIGHLLRHAVLRIEAGDGVLMADIAASGALLARLAAYYRDAGDAAQAEAIDAVLATGNAPLTGRAAMLRGAVQEALIDLQAKRPARGDDAAYRAARADIREYLRGQLEQEAALIHPAFADKGPRR
ncbi:MAG: hypothetical protein QM681_00400 [Novosphingobium sp.]